MTNTGHTYRTQALYSLWKICVGSIRELVPQKRDKHSWHPFKETEWVLALN